MPDPRINHINGRSGVCFFKNELSTCKQLYSGFSRKLVVALDIGTTFSGAAYALLDPGEVPQIRSVTRQASPIPDNLVINSDEREIGTQTHPILDPQKFLLSCITTTTETSVALIMAWIYGMMMRS